MYENLCEGTRSNAVIQIIDVKGDTVTGLHIHVQEQKENRDLLFPYPLLCLHQYSLLAQSWPDGRVHSSESERW